MRTQRGQALVEFALVAPVFFLLLAGVLDASFAFFSQLTVINAAAEAAHAASIYPDPTTMYQVAESRAKAATTILAADRVSVVDPPICVPIVSTSCDFLTATGSQRGDLVRITVNYEYRPFFPLLLGTTINLTSTAQAILQ
jgi:Flp pilus assembly protein TadG